MTAVCGIVGRGGKRHPAEQLDAVLARLEPFGSATARQSLLPGRGGAHVAVRSDDPSLALVEQRTPNGDLSMVFIGDVRLEHRMELAGQIGVRSERSDGELILAAYRRWGRKFVSRLHGEFAFAIVDEQKGGVLLVRDHAGRRPLVVHRHRERLAFASTAFALAALNGVPRGVDLGHAEEVAAGRLGTDRTFVHGVRILPAGHALWMDDARTRLWRWWRPGSIEVRDLGRLDPHVEQTREAVILAALAASPDRSFAVLDDGTLEAAALVLAARDQSGELPRVVEAQPEIDWLDPEFLAAEERRWELGSVPSRRTFETLPVVRAAEKARVLGIERVLTATSGPITIARDESGWALSLFLRGRFVRALREARSWKRRTGSSWRRVVRDEMVAPRRARRRTESRDSHRSRRAKAWERTRWLADVECVSETMKTVAVDIGVEVCDVMANRRLAEVARTQPPRLRRMGGLDRAILRSAVAVDADDPTWSERPGGPPVARLVSLPLRAESLRLEVASIAVDPKSREYLDVSELSAVAKRAIAAGSARRDEDESYLARSILVARYVRWLERRLHAA